MSKLVKLKLASKKSLACFLPNRMATPGASTMFPEAPDDDDGVKPAGVKPAAVKKRPETKSADAPRPRPPPESNMERAIVAVESTEPSSKGPKETPKPSEEAEILELKTPGFVRVFGCDECESENDDPSKPHSASSDESIGDDASSSRPSGPPPPRHLIPVVHLRVPMKSKDDVRKVVAALQLRGVLDVACDVENHIVKVTGNADPDRLLKKVKKVKRKSKLISYTNPVEMPIPPETTSFRSDIPPPYAFHQPAFRPPSHEPHVFSRDGPYGHMRPNMRPAASPMHYGSEAFYHHCNPPPNVRPPPPPPNVRPPPPAASAFFRDEPFRVRPPSSPPHYSSTSFYPERVPPNLRRSTSPPRRRSYYYDRQAPGFGPPPPPPPMHFRGGGPPSYQRRTPWGPGVPYDFQQVPDRMMHM